MWDNILLPLIGRSRQSEVEVTAIEIAARNHSTLHVLRITENDQLHSSRPSSPEVNGHKQPLPTDIEQEIKERDISLCSATRDGRALDVISSYASNNDIDLIVMPPHRKKITWKSLSTSVPVKILRSTNSQVLVIPHDHRNSRPVNFRHILVPTDGSTAGDSALTSGMNLVKNRSATLHVLSVVQMVNLGIDLFSQHLISLLETEADQIITEATQTAAETGLEDVTGNLCYGQSIYREINEYVEREGVDVIVIATNHRTGFEKLILGSVTERLLRSTKIPVLVVPKRTTGAQE